MLGVWKTTECDSVILGLSCLYYVIILLCPQVSPSFQRVIHVECSVECECSFVCLGSTTLTEGSMGGVGEGGVWLAADALNWRSSPLAYTFRQQQLQ